jgi:nucleoside-diphosphate-sugar epimerase
VSKVLITGATGTVGFPIARDLVERGDEVRALVRDVGRARELLPEGVEPLAGDVADRASVDRAVAGCELVFHAAGLPEQWRLDPSDFRRVNVDGSRNLAEASLAAGVRRLVYTSTIDVFEWTPGEPFDESVIDPEPRPTLYERSKQDADRIVVGVGERGLDVVFIHPAAVYGPVPALFAGANDLIVRLALGQIPMLLPGGMPLVYSEDVARAHLAAAEGASAGARFIVSGEYRTLAEIAESVAAMVPGAKVPRVMLLGVAKAVSTVGERIARITRKPPLIPHGALLFLISHPVPVADLAVAELGIELTSWTDGLAVTLDHFRAQEWKSAA